MAKCWAARGIKHFNFERSVIGAITDSSVVTVAALPLTCLTRCLRLRTTKKKTRIIETRISKKSSRIFSKTVLYTRTRWFFQMIRFFSRSRHTAWYGQKKQGLCKRSFAIVGLLWKMSQRFFVFFEQHYNGSPGYKPVPHGGPRQQGPCCRLFSNNTIQPLLLLRAKESRLLDCRPEPVLFTVYSISSSMPVTLIRISSSYLPLPTALLVLIKYEASVHALFLFFLFDRKWNSCNFPALSR